MKKPRTRRRKMDFLDNYGVSNRSFKLIYYGNLLFWVAFTMFLLLFLVVEITRDNSQSSKQNIPPKDDPFHIPDMSNILLWGFNGQGVRINISKLYPGHQEEYKSGYIKYRLNKYLSDRISMRRSLPDVRSQECKQVAHRHGSLLTVSVVVVFRNEPRTTLLRMLYSVIDRSPYEDIKEIILVDDSSDVEDLQFPKLEHYLSGLTKISIIRLSTHHGIARARMYGALRATGEVIIFLQPRCECTEGWMTPLLRCIAADPNTIAVPVVDRIDCDTFQYNHDTLSETKLGSFTWNLVTKRKPMTKPVESATTYIPNPVIVDGIFAVARDKLFQLGGFNEGLLMEDSVNIEFSFRSWMCGGQVVLVPCSHVGYLALLAPVEKSKMLEINTILDNLRIADTLMGSYKYFVYERMQLAAHTGKQQLDSLISQRTVSEPEVPDSCHSFHWFLQMVEPAMLFTGEIISRGRIFLLGANNKILSLGVLDGDVLLQDSTNTPATFWYHVKSGVLITENKTCLSYEPDNVETENKQSQYVTSSSIKVDNSWFDSDKNHYDPNTILQMNEVSAERQGQDQQDSIIHPIVSFEIQQLMTNKLLFNSDHSSVRHLLDNVQELNLKDRQQHQNGGHFEESLKVNFASSVETNTNSYETQIRSRSILNKIFPKLDGTKLLKELPKSYNRLNAQVTQNDNTYEQNAHNSKIVMKPCESQMKDDQWIYTEVQALQHVKSGLCMEGQEGYFGKYLLKMVQCDRNNWAQRWRFRTILESF